MLSQMRHRFGPIVLSGLVIVLAFVFVFSFDLFPQRSGYQSSPYAGKVNGDIITMSEFNRELDQRLEMFKRFNLDPENARKMGMHRQVFQALASRQIMRQEAERSGVLPGDQLVKENIKKIPAFQEAGVFNPDLYRRLLEANRFTPAQFEEDVRKGLVSQAWQEYFERRATVSTEEIAREYEMLHTTWDLRFALITRSAAAKELTVTDAEVKAFLAGGAANLDRVKHQFESRSTSLYKGKKLESVQSEIARELVALDRTEQVNAQIQEITKRALSAAAKSEAALKAVLKPYGIEVESLNGATRRTGSFGTAGKVDALAKDLPQLGAKPRSYDVAKGSLVAFVSASTAADRTKMLDKEREELRATLAAEKRSNLMQAWLKELESKAKIVPNEMLLAQEGEELDLSSN